MTLKPCPGPNCGRHFLGRTKRARYCSKLCQQRAWYARNYRPVLAKAKRRNAGIKHLGQEEFESYLIAKYGDASYGLKLARTRAGQSRYQTGG